MFVVTLSKTSLKKLGLGAMCCALVVCSALLGRFISQRTVAVSAAVNRIESAQDIQTWFTGYGLDVDGASITADKVKIPRKWDDSFSAFNGVVQQSGMDLARYKGKTVEKWTALIPAASSGETSRYGVLLVYKKKAVGAYLLERPSGQPVRLYIYKLRFSFLYFSFLFSLVDNYANAQSYLCMEIPRVRSEQRPFLDLQQEDDPVCQIDIKGRSQSTAINKTVPVGHCRPVGEQGGSPIDCLEAAQSGKPDTETDVPSLVRQYGDKVAEFSGKLRFWYRLVLISIFLYLIVQTVQPVSAVTVGKGKGQRGEVVTLTAALP